MKISYHWLKEFIEVDLDPRELAERLTMVGLTVDGVEEHGEDRIIEIDLTSNRPDCLSHLGVAREVGVIIGKRVQPPGGSLIESPTRTADLTSVEVMDPDLCPRYTARLIRGVKVGPSPSWMVRRLEAVGQRSINNVADITNYVLLELGQPLHAFDFQRLAGQRIIVRRARPGETLVTLDGVERILTPQMLVIADAGEAVALAGIMGGGDSEITDSTVDVLLESAYFAPGSIRQTARDLGMNTEASYRFERGIDPEIAARASDRAAALIAELAGGEVTSGLIDVRAIPALSEPIHLRLDRYQHLTGLTVEQVQAVRILEALGLTVEAGASGRSLMATPPSWRIDLAIEEDLIEEVVRITGYDDLQTTLPGGAGAGAYLDDESARRTVRRTLVNEGFGEAINFSFVNGANDERLSWTPEAGLRLTNPIDETQGRMRTTLLGGLIDSVERNINHGTRNIRLFEIGKCFIAADERPLEVERLALVMTGARNEYDWQAASEKLDYFDLKGMIEAISENTGKNSVEFHPTAGIRYLHPGRAAVISLTGNEIGFAGQLHPRIAANYKFKQPVYVAELDFGTLLKSPSIEPRYRPLPKYPAVTRDLSVLVEDGISWMEIVRRITGLNVPDLLGCRLFDLYAGRELPAGKRALALSLRYQADNRTLTDEEINERHGRVVEMLTQELGAELR